MSKNKKPNWEFPKEPCPAVSKNIIDFFSKEIKNDYNYLVEYGSGSSTLFWINKVNNYNINLISIENDYDWHNLIIKHLKKDFKLKNIIKKTTQTAIFGRIIYTLKLLFGLPKAPDQISKLNKWKKQPFFFIKKDNHIKSIFSCYNNKMFIKLINIPPKIKDQFYEAPNADQYISAGLMQIEKDLKTKKQIKAAFIIDGGPRGEIVNKILDLEEKYDFFQPTILLCDSYRHYYCESMKRRPSGKHIKGSNIKLNNELLYKKNSYRIRDIEVSQFLYGKNHLLLDDILNKEAWFYKRDLS